MFPKVANTCSHFKMSRKNPKFSFVIECYAVIPKYDEKNPAIYAYNFNMQPA